MTQVQVNREFLEDLSPFALQQINDYRNDKTNARQYAVKANQSLPDRSWRTVDSTILETQDDVFTLVSDLRQAGLVTERDIMTKHDTWPLVDDEGEADIAMTPEVATDEGALVFGDDGVPIPVIYDEFSLGFREGPSPESGETPGAIQQGLDTLGVSTTTRRVNEKVEEMFLDGWNQTINWGGDGFTLYGLTTHPQINTATFSEDWRTTTEASDGTVLRDDMRRARGIIKNDNNYAPGGSGYWVYMGTGLYDTLDDADPEGDGNTSVRQRINNLANIAQIRELDYLGDHEMLMFRPTEDVIDVGVALETQSVMWDDPFRDNWAVLSSIYPRVKTTATGQNGIVYMSL